MPDRSPIVIVNATPIISLALIGKLDLLHRLYGTVHTPPAVQSEVLAGGAKNIGVLELQQAKWLRNLTKLDVCKNYPGRLPRVAPFDSR